MNRDINIQKSAEEETFFETEVREDYINRVLKEENLGFIGEKKSIELLFKLANEVLKYK